MAGSRFGGLREHGGTLTLDPRLPTGIHRLAFRIRRRGVRLLVEIDHQTVRCSARDGADQPLPLRLYHEQIVVRPGEPVQRPIQPLEPLLPPPPQPAGREPMPHDMGGH